MKRKIRLGFSDFYPLWNSYDNYFTRLLGEKYEVIVSDQPEFLIYSCYGDNFRRHRGIRVYYTGENLRPNFNDCDYAFTFDFCDHPRHMRLPYWRARSEEYPFPTVPSLNPQAVLASKTRFCNFVYSNKYCPTRNRFFRLLSKYKRVDAGGRLFNNIGGRIGGMVTDKLDFLRPYKFTIAFENDLYPGYTTEKLYEPMLVDSLPIYWGNPRVQDDFNPASFLNCHSYGSLKALVQRVIEVDQNDDLYCHYLQQPRFPPGAIQDADFRQQVLSRFEQIFSTSKTPVAQQPRTSRYFIIHPAERMTMRLKQKSLRLARKISYRLDLARIQIDSMRQY